jgi:diguanylate cyclase (GGDEF)-like protein/PAS domain S-box-containing protein
MLLREDRGETMTWWRRRSRRAPASVDLRHLVDRIPDVVILAIDADLRILEVTGGLSWRLRRKLPDLVGRQVTELGGDGQFTPWLSAYHRALDGSHEHFEIASSDGAGRFAVDIAPLHDPGDDAVAIVVIRDVQEQRAAAEALASSTSRAEAILGALHEGVLVRDGHGVLVESNEAFNRMFDFDPEGDVDAAHWKDLPLVRPDGTELPQSERPGAAVHEDGHARIGLPIGVPRDDGTTQWLRINIVPFIGPDGLRWTVTTMVDETERRAAERLNELAHNRLSSLLENSSELVSVLDRTTSAHLWVNSAWVRILGWDPREQTLEQRVANCHPDDLETARDLIAEVAETPGLSHRFSLRFRHADGSWRHFEATFTNLVEDEAVGGIVMNAHDVTERVHAAAALADMAMHDGLTGLPNRRLVLDRIGQALEEQRRSGATVAVLFMDLDDFKAVNDSHGHAAGDQLLVTVGNRLAASVRAIDTVGRIGGDEFVIVAVLSDGTGAESVARHIEDALHEPITIGDDIVVNIDASVGLVLSEPNDPRSATELLTGADQAMYELKRRRRLRIVN